MIYNHITATPTLLQFVLSVFVTFFVVYRYNVQRRIRYRFGWGERDATKWNRFVRKILNCNSCFGFWLCLCISTNIVTGAAAFLLFNYYEND